MVSVICYLLSVICGVCVCVCVCVALVTKITFISLLVQANLSEIEKPSSSKQCAFQMMNISSDCSKLPDLMNPMDNKNKLKNAVYKFLERNNVGWTRDGCDVHGSMFLNTITECLWYIDGNHHTLKDRGYDVPEELSHLTTIVQQCMATSENCRVIEIYGNK